MFEINLLIAIILIATAKKVGGTILGLIFPAHAHKNGMVHTGYSPHQGVSVDTPASRVGMDSTSVVDSAIAVWIRSIFIWFGSQALRLKVLPTITSHSVSTRSILNQSQPSSPVDPANEASTTLLPYRSPQQTYLQPNINDIKLLVGDQELTRNTIFLQEVTHQEQDTQDQIHREQMLQDLIHQDQVHQEHIRREQERRKQDLLRQKHRKQERRARDRLARQRLEQARFERECLEQERLGQEHFDREYLKEERREQEQFELEYERLDRKLHERERLEQERLERERLEQERLEQQRLEQERLEQERLHQERLEQERRERERLEREQLERERDPERRRQARQELLDTLPLMRYIPAPKIDSHLSENTDNTEADESWGDNWVESDMPYLPLEEHRRGCYICMMDFDEPRRRDEPYGDDSDIQEGPEPLRLLPCGHACHKSCVDPWILDESPTCPYCRKVLMPSFIGSTFSSLRPRSPLLRPRSSLLRRMRDIFQRRERPRSANPPDREITPDD